jgi:hypothetical protein
VLAALTPPSLLLAFGFTNLAMLGWLAAAAAPLLIHLWSRHRFREAPWAAMQFLLAAMRKNARRLQLQQWLLLAVRTLIIVLVVLAVAEPYGEQLLAGGSAAPIHKVIVIDTSFSMDYQGDAITTFGRAKQLAAQLVRESRQGDVFTVIDMSRPAKTIVGSEVIDHAAVATQIETLRASHTDADLPAALTLVQQTLTSDKSARKFPDKAEVYFLTDLQRTTWAQPTESEQSAIRNPQSEITAPLASLAQNASFTVIDLGQPKSENLAITNLTTSDSFVTPGRETSFDVTLHQFAQEPRTQCNVEFLVDDVPVGQQIVDVPAGGDATARFTHRFQSAGSHAICVRVPGDRLNVDNVRWLVVPVRAEVRVLCIAGREGAAKYVADALNPNPTGDSPIRPVIISDGDLADVTLADFDCVFLCNVAQLTASEAERLARYAAAGRGVVIFLGDRVIPDSYNALTSAGWGRGSAEPPAAQRSGGSLALDPSRPQQPLLPAGITDLISQPQFGLDPLEYRHPIVAPFRGRERAGLLTTPVARHYRLDVPKDRPDVEVAAALPGGDPFIVTSALGRGRVVLVATDGSLSSVDATTGEPWTNWPTWPSFLPIVRELLSFAAGSQHDRWQQLVGTPLASQAPLPDETKLQLKRPDGRTAPVSIQSTPAGPEWSYADTNVSGIYSLSGLPHDQNQQFAVNVDTTESNLEKVDLDELPPELVVRSTWQDSNTARTTDILSQSSWNLSFLWAVLALMFVESALAWHFGRGTA